MLGNFLTTLGNRPEEDHAMFREHGLNIAPQPDNGSNPRPDNRSGWLDGETPDVVADHIAAAAPALAVTLWDPSAQLRYRKKSSVPPRPDQANNAWPGPDKTAGSPDQVGWPNSGLRSAA
jgi:biotin synthase